MSARILSRSRWTSTSPGGRAVTWSRIRGIVCHYPAMGASVGVLSASQEQSRIRGWRNYHVGALGWSDLGYNYVICQSGRIYTGRGDRVGAHAVGHNSRTLGVLFMVGDNEPLTDAARASFRALRATLRKRGCGSGVWGHTQMSGNSTRCPGPYIMGDIRSGALTGKAAPVQKAEPWEESPRVRGMSTAEVKRVQQALVDAGYSLGSYGVDGSYGKDTYNAVRAFQKAAGLAVDGVAGPDTRRALAGGQSKPKPTTTPKAPTFPLPRKKGALYFYGLGKKKTAVTGKMRNTGVPKDVVKDANGKWYSKGLKKLQAQLKKRGYGLAVDGRFGAETDRIIRYFQKLVGLKVDGEVGPKTWAAVWEEPVR